jgi:hypothetical protein
MRLRENIPHQRDLVILLVIAELIDTDGVNPQPILKAYSM